VPTKNTPIYILSALTDNETISKTKELGASGYIKNHSK